jgi:alginate O-acetyltransferase complex protein AlgI
LHGAGLTFIAWGLYHGLLLILERFAHTQWDWRPSGVVGIAASFILLMIGWVLFRSPTLGAAGHYLTAMALLGPHAGGITVALSGLTGDVMFYLALGTFFAFA